MYNFVQADSGLGSFLHHHCNSVAADVLAKPHMHICLDFVQPFVHLEEKSRNYLYT